MFLLFSDGHIQEVDVGFVVHLRDLHSGLCLHLVDKNKNPSSTDMFTAHVYILSDLF